MSKRKTAAVVNYPESMKDLYYQILRDLKYECVEHIADIAGVHENTLRYWMRGHTKNPRIDTLLSVAAALGYELTWTRSS